MYAQRTKFPAPSRWVAFGLASHVSKSPWRAVARVRPCSASQSSRAMAARMLPRAAVDWLRVVSAQPADHMPEGVAVQQLPLVGVVTLGDHVGDPAFQPGHVLVAGLQRADRD